MTTNRPSLEDGSLSQVASISVELPDGSDEIYMLGATNDLCLQFALMQGMPKSYGIFQFKLLENLPGPVPRSVPKVRFAQC